MQKTIDKHMSRIIYMLPYIHRPTHMPMPSDNPPDSLSSDSDVLHALHNAMATKNIPFRWIPSHRDAVGGGGGLGIYHCSILQGNTRIVEVRLSGDAKDGHVHFRDGPKTSMVRFIIDWVELWMEACAQSPSGIQTF